MSHDYFCFSLDRLIFGIPLEYISKVISAVQLIKIPNSPPIISGLIDFSGSLIPVINLYHRLNLESKEVQADQFFVILDTIQRKIVLVADSLQGLVSINQDETIQARSLDSGMENIHLFRTEDGVILLYKPEDFIAGTEDFFIEMDNELNN